MWTACSLCVSGKVLCICHIYIFKGHRLNSGDVVSFLQIDHDYFKIIMACLYTYTSLNNFIYNSNIYLHIVFSLFFKVTLNILLYFIFEIASWVEIITVCIMPDPSSNLQWNCYIFLNKKEAYSKINTKLDSILSI